MGLKGYVFVALLFLLLGAAVGAVAMAADVGPLEPIDDVLGETPPLPDAGGGDGASTPAGGETTPTETAADDGPGGDDTATPTATATDGGTATPASDTATPAGTATPTATPFGSAFSYAINEITECGSTCRDVTATLTNDQDDAAEDVVIVTEMYAGNQTSEDALVYTSNESAGTLGSGESHTFTQQLELTLSEAADVRDEDGWVAIVTTIHSEGETKSFVTRRQII